MKKRLLDTTPSELREMNKEEKLQAIKANEGRTLMAEIIVSMPPVVVGHATNGELAAALSVDMILLNTIDLYNPQIYGIDDKENPIKRLKQLTGKMVGANLEPIDMEAQLLEPLDPMSEGRKANKEMLKKAEELCLDFIVLTGNPRSGVSNKSILDSIKLAKENYNGIIIAGKMHGAGVSEKIVDLESIEQFIDAGADIILLPAAGTVPGVSEEDIKNACSLIKSHNRMSLVANGTSQDNAPKEIIRDIALMNKMAGADIHHIGDSGPSGIAPWMNILELSRTIRGDRHTLRMMACSLLR